MSHRQRGIGDIRLSAQADRAAMLCALLHCGVRAEEGLR